MICPRCGTENDLEQSYCRQCGLTLSTVRLALEGHLDEAMVKIKHARNTLRNGAGITVMSVLILILGHLIGSIGGSVLILTPFDLLVVGIISLIGVPLIIKGALGIERANNLLSGKDMLGRSTLGRPEQSSTALPSGDVANSLDARLQAPEPVTEHTTIHLEGRKPER